MNNKSFYAKPSADTCILQLQGEHEKDLIESELAMIQEVIERDDFCLMIIPVSNWNEEMSPWEVPSPFGDGKFGAGASGKLEEIVTKIIPEFEQAYPNPNRRYYLAGYSLAGLFSLWSSYNTDKFEGIAAVSPSVWYPDWIEYANNHPTKASKIYLSLGDKESRTRNKIMSKVEDIINAQHELLLEQNVDTILEWNEGNHFADVAHRMARGIIWLTNN